MTDPGGAGAGGFAGRAAHARARSPRRGCGRRSGCRCCRRGPGRGRSFGIWPGGRSGTPRTRCSTRRSGCRSTPGVSRCAPRAGVARLVGGFGRWVFDLEGEPLRQVCARREDPETYLKLSRQRDARVRWRGMVAVPVLALVIAVAVLLAVARPRRPVGGGGRDRGRARSGRAAGGQAAAGHRGDGAEGGQADQRRGCPGAVRAGAGRDQPGAQPRTRTRSGSPRRSPATARAGARTSTCPTG